MADSEGGAAPMTLPPSEAEARAVDEDDQELVTALATEGQMISELHAQLRALMDEEIRQQQQRQQQQPSTPPREVSAFQPAPTNDRSADPGTGIALATPSQTVLDVQERQESRARREARLMQAQLRQAQQRKVQELAEQHEVLVQELRAQRAQEQLVLLHQQQEHMQMQIQEAEHARQLQAQYESTAYEQQLASYEQQQFEQQQYKQQQYEQLALDQAQYGQQQISVHAEPDLAHSEIPAPDGSRAGQVFLLDGQYFVAVPRAPLPRNLPPMTQ